MSWREQIRNGYPWKPLVFVGLTLALAIAVAISMIVLVPAERDVIANGTTTTGHAVAYKDLSSSGRSVIGYSANLTWFDSHGQQHEQKGLGISQRAFREIGDGKDVEIKYEGDMAVIVSDIQHRVRDESNAPVMLVVVGIALLMGLYHWRRRLREWRAPKPVQW